MSTTATPAPGAASRPALGQREFFGHPVGLFVLFFTEMWERFSYYGMRALLVLYMTKYLLAKEFENPFILGFGPIRAGLEGVFGPLAIQPMSSQIYGLYTALVYLTPVVGGYIADKYLGQRKTVVVGGVLMAIGHFLMAYEALFLFALLFIIGGNGCFKPNVSSQVGNLYPEGDPRRDRAFNIFYMGINLGAFFAPLVCGTLGQVYGWHYGFTAAGFGMIAGLIVYIWGQKYLGDDGFVKGKAAVVEKQPLTQKEWRAVWGLIGLACLNIVFWAVYEQQGNTIQIFADQNTNWTIFGWEMPSTWFQAVNAMFIFMFVPFINIFWNHQAARKKEPSSVAKTAIGCILLGLSFLVLVYVSHGMQATDRFSFLWLVGCTAIYTLGEIYLSPVGLSLVTKVAPKRIVGLMMGLWFTSTFFGNYLSGFIGMFYESMSKQNFFYLLTALGVLAGLAIFALQKPLKNAIGHNV